MSLTTKRINYYVVKYQVSSVSNAQSQIEKAGSQRNANLQKPEASTKFAWCAEVPENKKVRSHNRTTLSNITN